MSDDWIDPEDMHDLAVASAENPKQWTDPAHELETLAAGYLALERSIHSAAQQLLRLAHA